MKNWKIIFGMNIYHCVFVEDRFNKCIHAILDNLTEIKKEKDLCIILPTIYDLQHKDVDNNFHQYSHFLKNFFESSQKTLIIHEQIFDVLIKDEQKLSFFKFLYKRKKTIFIIYHEHKKEKMDNLFLNIKEIKSYKKQQYNHESFLRMFNLNETFNYINQYVYNLNKLFKNPIVKT